MKIIECPRDAMQGLHDFIPTQLKADYINQLLKVGFDTIDFGSFVSPKAIPQLKDTAEVLDLLDLEESSSSLLAIVANLRGAHDASNFDEIEFLGFPFSISEEFQKRNTNSSIEESLNRVEEIQKVCLKHKKELVLYISMAFGNPYGEMWHPDIAIEWGLKLNKELGVNILALSDTIGSSNPENITTMYQELSTELTKVEIGVHLHSTPDSVYEKIEAAIKAGCTRFDGAIKGYGGCPMAKDDLTGNMPTEEIIKYLDSNTIDHHLNSKEFNKSLMDSDQIFSNFS